MPGMIKIDANELDHLSKEAKRLSGNTLDVVTHITNAISGTDWMSNAAESFKDLWQRDKGILHNLQQDLESWSRHCASQVEPARRVNRPF